MSQGGRDGPAAFWTAYRDSFDEIASTFSQVLEREGAIALEWRSTGSAKERNFVYEGVSIIETGEAGVTAFRTYFDSAGLGRELAAQRRVAPVSATSTSSTACHQSDLTRGDTLLQAIT